VEQCMSSWGVYLKCYYWALGLVTGSTSTPLPGPGAPPQDVHAPFTVGEEFVLIIITLLASALWAYVTAKLVDIITNSDPDTTIFRNTMDDVNRFANFHKMPPSRALELREYYHEKRELMRAEAREKVTEGLSFKLASEVAWEMHKNWIVSIDFLRDAEKPFLTKLALMMKQTLFAPLEQPPPRRLYVIFKGTVRYNRGILAPGEYFGHRDVLLRNDYSPRPKAFALTFVQAHYIDTESLRSLAKEDDFPEAMKFINRWVILTALKHWLIMRVRQTKRDARGLFTATADAIVARTSSNAVPGMPMSMPLPGAQEPHAGAPWTNSLEA
jgi:CRP-like cAMP-binding protein